MIKKLVEKVGQLEAKLSTITSDDSKWYFYAFVFSQDTIAKHDTLYYTSHVVMLHDHQLLLALYFAHITETRQKNLLYSENSIRPSSQHLKGKTTDYYLHTLNTARPESFQTMVISVLLKIFA